MKTQYDMKHFFAINTDFTQTALSTKGAAVAKALAPTRGTARPSAKVD